MFRLPARLDYKTLRKAFNNPLYKRMLMLMPRQRQAAQRRNIPGLSFTS